MPLWSVHEIGRTNKQFHVYVEADGLKILLIDPAHPNEAPGLTMSEEFLTLALAGVKRARECPAPPAATS